MCGQIISSSVIRATIEQSQNAFLFRQGLTPLAFTNFTLNLLDICPLSLKRGFTHSRRLFMKVPMIYGSLLLLVCTSTPLHVKNPNLNDVTSDTAMGILSESLFGIIGILDDLIVLIMCVLYVVTIYRNFAAQNPTTA